MKRIVLRITALLIVVVLGVIAIAQAQRRVSASVDSPAEPTSPPPAVQTAGVSPDPGAPSVSLQPLPPDPRDADSATLSAAADPFAVRARAARETAVRLVSAHEPAGVPGAMPPIDAQPLDAAQEIPAAAAAPAPMTATAVGDRYATRSAAPSRAGPELPAGIPNDPAAPPLMPVNPIRAAEEASLEPVATEQPAPSRAFPLADASTPAEPPAISDLEPQISPVAPAAELPTADGTGRPGAAELEGPQVPQLAIEKVAPEQVSVGKPAVFRTTVHNTGKVPALDVEIADEVPAGTSLVSTQPSATVGPQGELVWALGEVSPGQRLSVEMVVMPVAEGEVGSVASVRFQAGTTARATVTRPQLAVDCTAPKQVLLGDEVSLSIRISNPGTGVASGVVLIEQVPPGLRHPAGAELERNVGDIQPGQSLEFDLQLTATGAGPTTNVIVARADANLQAEHRFELEVLSPQLEVGLEGPKRRYLEREASYTLSVSNPGSAPAQNVELLAYLPPGLKFVSANNNGHFDPQTKTIQWLLAELPANDTGSVQLVTMPVEAGDMKLRLVGRAEKGLTSEKEQDLIVEGIAAILFELVDVEDPIEKGGETSYEIRVVNQGSKAATNVRLAVSLPPELQPVSAESDTPYAIQNNAVVFEPLPRLAPKADTTYRVRVQGLQPGDLRARVELQTDEMDAPVVKEESTRVYADE